MDNPTPPIPPSRRPPGALTGGLILIGLGIIFTVRELGLLTRRGFWPWILIVVGVSLIITHLVTKERNR